MELIFGDLFGVLQCYEGDRIVVRIIYIRRIDEDKPCRIFKHDVIPAPPTAPRLCCLSKRTTSFRSEDDMEGSYTWESGYCQGGTEFNVVVRSS